MLWRLSYSPVGLVKKMADYYEILGVPQAATDKEVKAAYRSMALQWHPDVNPDPDSTRRMQEINEAYDTLSDQGRRRSYDFRTGHPVAEPQGQGFNASDFFTEREPSQTEEVPGLYFVQLDSDSTEKPDWQDPDGKAQRLDEFEFAIRQFTGGNIRSVAPHGEVVETIEKDVYGSRAELSTVVYVPDLETQQQIEEKRQGNWRIRWEEIQPEQSGLSPDELQRLYREGGYSTEGAKMYRAVSNVRPWNRTWTVPKTEGEDSETTWDREGKLLEWLDTNLPLDDLSYSFVLDEMREDIQTVNELRPPRISTWANIYFPDADDQKKIGDYFDRTFDGGFMQEPNLHFDKVYVEDISDGEITFMKNARESYKASRPDFAEEPSQDVRPDESAPPSSQFVARPIVNDHEVPNGQGQDEVQPVETEAMGQDFGRRRRYGI